MKKFMLSALLAATTLVAAPAEAAVTFFNSLASFNAAAGATTTEDFADNTLIPGLSIVSTNGNIGGGVFNDRLIPGGATTTFSFASGIKAFGGNFDLSPNGAGIGISLTLTPGGILSTEVPRTSTGQFFGFVSDTAFTSVLFTGGTQGGGAETYNLDNLAFGPGGVPEPAAWAMLIGGFGVVGGAMRRRRTSATVYA